MNLNTYQAEAAKFAIYPPACSPLYPLLGLVGEVGELVDKLLPLLFPDGIPAVLPAEKGLKKALEDMAALGTYAEYAKKDIRDSKRILFDENALQALFERLAAVRDNLNTEGILKELGDAQWYLADLARQIGFPLEEVGRVNLEKLQSRMDRGKLGGSGDSR